MSKGIWSYDDAQNEIFAHISRCSITFGMLGPLAYGLSLRDSALVILFFGLFSTIAPAYLATLGPKTGMRQMIQARYSFGYGNTTTLRSASPY